MSLARWSAPRVGAGNLEDERAVGWLELFYDLVFVAALIQFGSAFGNDLTWAGAGRFAALFTLLWWSWTSTTFYMNRIVVDDLPQRVLIVAQMFAIGIVATIAGDVFDGSTATFALAYAGIRLTVATMYLRAFVLVPGARVLAGWNAAAFSIGAGLWIISALLDEPWRYLLWVGAVLVDLSWIYFRRIRHVVVTEMPPRLEHMYERYGVFTLIVLGESFIKTISSVAEKGVTTDTQVLGLFGLAIAAALWWTYFDDVADSPINQSRSPVPMSVWIYGHLPMTLGLTATGVGIQKLVTSKMDEPLARPSLTLLTLALVLTLVSVAMLDLVTRNRHFGVTERDRLVPRLSASGALVLLALFGSGWTALAIGITTATIVVAQIASEIVAARRAHRDMQERVAAGVAADAEGDACSHLADLGHAEPVSAGCLACIEENLVWVHLRLCTDCGTVGCCDDSPGRHARHHAGAARHPTVRSLEPGERWAYCYPDQKGALLEGA